MRIYTWGLFPDALSRHLFCSRVSRKKVNNKGGKGDCVSGMVHGRTPLRDEGKSRSLDEGASCTALKIKRYWLKPETVTFHWDGIYYSEKRSTKYYAVWLWGKKKKHPLLIKTLFWDEGFDFNWWIITVFLPLSQKMRFLKKHFLKQILPLLGFPSSERKGILSTYIHSARSCPN